jgi:hypothetical protein
MLKQCGSLLTVSSKVVCLDVKASCYDSGLRDAFCKSFREINKAPLGLAVVKPGQSVNLRGTKRNNGELRREPHRRRQAGCGDNGINTFIRNDERGDVMPHGSLAVLFEKRFDA